MNRGAYSRKDYEMIFAATYPGVRPAPTPSGERGPSSISLPTLEESRTVREVEDVRRLLHERHLVLELIDRTPETRELEREQLAGRLEVVEAALAKAGWWQ